MFDLGWTELLVIAVVAIVVIGPNDLPRAMRTVGQWTGKMRRMARDFQGQFNEALREAELDTVKREVQEIGKIDPIKDMRKEMAKVGADIKKDMDVRLPDETKAAKAVEAPKAESSGAVMKAAEPPAPSEPAEPAAAKPAEPDRPAEPAKTVVAANAETETSAAAPAKSPSAPTKAKRKAKPRKAKAAKPAPGADPVSAAEVKS